MEDSGITFQREPLHAFWNEAMPLFEQHWQEIAKFKDIPLAPDRVKYDALEVAGVFRAFTARLAGRLIGYVGFFVGPHLHYAGSVQATQDVLFLVPEHRHGRTGSRLIAYADNVLRDEGVQCTSQHVKVANDFGPLLERMGYELTEKIYLKRLDHGRN